MGRTALVVVAFALAAGCSNEAAVRRPEAPANVTYPLALGDYQRVYNTTYHVVNRYGVIEKASYRYGEIQALVGQDNAFFDKTRRTVLARIFENPEGNYWDVECKVLLEVDQSDVESLSEHQPRDNYRAIARDTLMETKLENEIRSDLTGGAWDAKTPLVPDSRAPAAPPVAGEHQVYPQSQEGPAEKPSSNLRDARATLPSTTPDVHEASVEECERSGVRLMEQGNYDRAVEAFAKAHDAGPGSPYAAYLLGQALFATGDYAHAAQAIREGALRNPEWPTSKVDLRSFYGEDSDLKAQIAKLESHVQACSGDLDAQLVLGYVDFFTHDFEGAQKLFAAMQKAQPQDTVVQAYQKLSQVEIDRARGLEEF